MACATVLFFCVIAEETVFVFFEEASELTLVAAKLFFATGTIQTAVRVGCEAFGMHTVGDLPTQKQKQRKSEQGIRIYARKKDKRREHHSEIPIIDSAGRATAILHEPRLERAEKEDADDVADGIGDRDQEENAAVDDVCEIQRADHTV